MDTGVAITVHPDRECGLGDPPVFLDLYESSLAAADTTGEAELAAIPVERIGGEVVLVAGGDDKVWPSVTCATRIAQRRGHHNLATSVVTHPSAGHRVVLPGEAPGRISFIMPCDSMGPTTASRQVPDHDHGLTWKSVPDREVGT